VTTRRAFIGTLAGGLLAAPLAAEAQLRGKAWRMAVLGAPLCEGKNLSLGRPWRRKRLCHGDGAHGRGDRRRRGLMLALCSISPPT
jgi:hypothetical protein